MKYSVRAKSISGATGSVFVKQSVILFGTTVLSKDSLANPAELFLSSLASCILKNVERFSVLLKFEYSHAEINMSATRLEKPSRFKDIDYDLRIFSVDSMLNVGLLKKNIEKFGTIYNTINMSCNISGEVNQVSNLVI